MSSRRTPSTSPSTSPSTLPGSVAADAGVVAVSATLRRAAEQLRTPRIVDFCSCKRRDSWFDRSICPDPCGSMHDVCINCGMVIGRCSWRLEAAMPTAANLALAGWLIQHAAVHEDPIAAAGCFDVPATAGLPATVGCPALPVAHSVLED